jgi:CTP synthase
VELQDAYISITESLKHAALHNEAELDIRWVNAEKIEATGTDLDKVFEGVDGILVPGGFGDRGIEGKISAVRYAREHKIPFFGICLGMQCAVIEFARNVCGMKDANSSEFRAEVPAVIDLMPDQVDIEDKGGTMRLGLYPCKVYPGTLTDKAYGQPLVYERHRHRYEFNNEYRDVLTEHGLVLGGISPDDRLVEIVELPQSEHPWFLGCQFHPEFKSRPTKAHPLFRDFIAAALQYKK